jgi:Zn-dependent peptidase ImmA (M78 family)
MSIYYNKQGLYKEIAKLKNHLGFEESASGIDLVEHLENIGILIEKLPYKTKGLRGMAVLGNEQNEDIIILNQSRGILEQNYDCAHEVVHLSLHRTVGLNLFNCFDNITENQNPFYEWHANEGAAEMLVPYKVLLPIIKEHKKYLFDYYDIESFRDYLSVIFYVPEAVIKYRFANLKYEISQYLSGKSIDEIEILSLSQQQKRGIYIKSINEVCEECFCQGEPKTS